MICTDNTLKRKPEEYFCDTYFVTFKINLNMIFFPFTFSNDCDMMYQKAFLCSGERF